MKHEFDWAVGETGSEDRVSTHMLHVQNNFYWSLFESSGQEDVLIKIKEKLEYLKTIKKNIAAEATIK